MWSFVGILVAVRIALLADPGTVNGWYRGIGPLSTLAGEGGHVVIPLSVDRKQPPVGALRDVDVLHIHRYADERVERLVREATVRGVAVVWDDDDHFGAIPKDTAAYRRYGGHGAERRLAAMRRLFRHVDLVTTPSEVLAERLRQYGATRTAVIENYIPSLFLQHRIAERSGFTIGWIAAMEHQIDAERVPIADALQRLLDERPEVRVRTIGLRLGLRGAGYESIRHVPHMETVQRFDPREVPKGAPRGIVQANRGRRDVRIKQVAPGGLANHTAEFDVGIAPLADIEFNRARSNVKLKEYAAGGTPWLASPVGPYSGLGEAQGGRLVSDDRWYEELCALIDKPRMLRKLAKRAAKWVQRETLEQHVHLWEDALLQAIDARARRGGVPGDAVDAARAASAIDT